MKRCFATFGGGSDRFRDAAERLGAEIAELKLFDTVRVVTGEALLEDPAHAEFSAEYGEFIGRHARGFGFWCWKPYVIDTALETLADGDLLIYADAGCEAGSRRDFQMLFQELETLSFMGQTTAHDHIRYCKRHTLERLDPEGRFRSALMREATILAIRVNPETRSLIREWRTLLLDKALLTDPSADEVQSAEFVDHRHDQAVLSLLLYSRYSRFPEPGRGYLARALIPVRTRHGRSGRYLRRFLDGSHKPLGIERFESIGFSSTSEWSTAHDASDVITHSTSPARHDRRRHFTFHTADELRPHVRFKFRTLQLLSLVIIENRWHWDAKGFDRLLIASSDDGVTYRELTSVSYTFGSTLDYAPLVVCLPYNFRTRFVVVQALNQSTPRPLHLNCVLFFTG